MRGIAMFASNADDPYVTLHVDSDDEEKEDIEIKPADNLVVLSKIDRVRFLHFATTTLHETEIWQKLF